MADKQPATWLIILALQAQLATITKANGYLTDIGNSVWTADAQRPAEDALGLMIYAEPITGPGLDNERPGKPVRDFTMLVEAAIDTTLDNAQLQAHSIVEDIETCMQTYSRAQAWVLRDVKQRTPPVVSDIAILDRPEGFPVIAIQVRVVARYLR